MTIPDAAEPPIAVLSSGHSVILDEVMLFPELEIAHLLQLRAAAAKQFGGVSSGIGVIGSPAWAIGGALAIGLIEGLASSAMKDKAATLLKEASVQLMRMTGIGRFIPYADITGMELPSPQAWQFDETIDVTVKFRREISAGSLFGKITTAEEERIERRTTRFAHFEQEFVPIRNSSGIVHLKWSDVSAFRPGKRAQKAVVERQPFLTTAELAAERRKQITDPNV